MPTLSPVQYPLAAPTVANSQISVATMLQQPTRITRYLNDLSLKKFATPLIFGAPAGPVSGGAVLYDQLTLNDLFTTRDVQNVEPGAEFPIVTSEMVDPKVAAVEKFGGKFFITDEARDRNDQGKMQTEGRKLINTITRKIDQKAIAVLDAAIATYAATQTVVGVSWSAVVTAGSSASTATAWPAADLAKIQLKADQAELGVEPNLWLVNPAQWASFRTVYGQALQGVLESYGIQMYATNRVPVGTAYALEAGMVGEIRLEKPLSTETWRDHNTQRTWVQSDIRPVMYVTNPMSVFKVTGIA